MTELPKSSINSLQSSPLKLIIHSKDQFFAELIQQECQDQFTVEIHTTPTETLLTLLDKYPCLLILDMDTCADHINDLHEIYKKTPTEASLILAGSRTQAHHLMRLIEQKQAYRLLMKPLSLGQLHITIEAAKQRWFAVQKNTFINDEFLNQTKNEFETTKHSTYTRQSNHHSLIQPTQSTPYSVGAMPSESTSDTSLQDDQNTPLSQSLTSPPRKPSLKKSCLAGLLTVSFVGGMYWLIENQINVFQHFQSQDTPTQSYVQKSAKQIFDSIHTILENSPLSNDNFNKIVELTAQALYIFPNDIDLLRLNSEVKNQLEVLYLQSLHNNDFSKSQDYLNAFIALQTPEKELDQYNAMFDSRREQLRVSFLKLESQGEFDTAIKQIRLFELHNDSYYKSLYLRFNKLRVVEQLIADIEVTLSSPLSMNHPKAKLLYSQLQKAIRISPKNPKVIALQSKFKQKVYDEVHSSKESQSHILMDLAHQLGIQKPLAQQKQTILKEPKVTSLTQNKKSTQSKEFSTPQPKTAETEAETKLVQQFFALIEKGQLIQNTNAPDQLSAIQVLADLKSQSPLLPELNTMEKDLVFLLDLKAQHYWDQKNLQEYNKTINALKSLNYNGLTLPALIADSSNIQTPGAQEFSQSLEPPLKIDKKQLELVEYIKPTYPSYAFKSGIPGWVDVAFHIDSKGNTSNINIVKASPQEIFDEAAINAITQWKYQPPVTKANQVAETQVRLHFISF